MEEKGTTKVPSNAPTHNKLTPIERAQLKKKGKTDKTKLNAFQEIGFQTAAPIVTEKILSYEQLKEKYEHLKGKYDAIKEKVEKYSDTIIEGFKEQIDDLQTKNKILEDQNKDLLNKIERLEKKIAFLEIQLKDLSMRQVLLSLEHWIAVDLVKNKTKIKSSKLYTIKLLGKSAYKADLDKLLPLEAQNFIGFLKDEGDGVAHAPPNMNELIQAVNEEEYETSSNEEENKQQEQYRKYKLSFIELLDSYCHSNNRPFGWDPLKTEKEQEKIFQKKTYN